MRLFTAVELESELRAGAAGAARALQSRIERSSPGVRARWTPEENLHVTLFFLGEVHEDRLPTVLSALDAPFHTPRFVFGLSGAGVFPPSGLPRVIWLGIGEGTDALVSLQAEVTARLEGAGFEAERRRYHPHVTVARVADAARAEHAAIRRAVGEESGSAGSCEARHVTLFRSRSTQKGAAYEAMLRVPLRT